MSEQYVILERLEDEPSSSIISKENLEKRMNDGDFKGYNFLEVIPDLEYFPPRSVFIFKGSIIIPKAEKVVTKWKIR